jgi:hypothetical protein
MIAITTSINYGDKLRICLELNHTFFRKWFVVTSEDDLATIKVCQSYSNVEILHFDFSISSQGKCAFNKGGALQYCQQQVYRDYSDEWYLILDSDIILPDNFPQLLERVDWNQDSLYGAEGRDDYDALSDIQSQKAGKAYELEAECLGFFQLYYRHLCYSESQTARSCDAVFRNLFRNHLHIPGLRVKHMGKPWVNHNGVTGNDFHMDCQIDWDLIRYSA